MATEREEEEEEQLAKVKNMSIQHLLEWWATEQHARYEDVVRAATKSLLADWKEDVILNGGKIVGHFDTKQGRRYIVRVDDELVGEYVIARESELDETVLSTYHTRRQM